MLTHIFRNEYNFSLPWSVMACFPLFFTVIENDLRRVLTKSLLNQAGFIVVGIGTALAINNVVY